MPPPRRLPTPEGAPQPAPHNPPSTIPLGEEASILLGAARNAAARRQWDQAIPRYEEYFRRFRDERLEVRREYAGILVQAGRTRQALQEYQQLLARHPDDAALALVAADIAILTRDYQQAIALLSPIVQKEPGNVEAANRLARALLFEGDFPRALQVVDQHLANLRPGEARVPRTFPALLVDMERSTEALAFVRPMLDSRPGDAELLAICIRAYSRLEDRPRALEAVQALAGAGASASGIRQGLADGLLTSGDFELAGIVYQQLLQFDSTSSNARIGLARVAMQQFQPEQARTTLQAVTPPDDARRNWLLARAEYHQLVGEYVEAKTIYEQQLRQNPLDHEVRLSLGVLYEQPLREDERAKAEYAKIPAGTPVSRAARVGVASALTNQRHFAEAVRVLRALLAEYPADGNAMGQLVRTLAKAGRWIEGVALGREFLQANARNIPAVLAVKLAIGRALLEGRDYSAAVAEFEQVLTLPGGRQPQTYYGLSRAAVRLGDPVKARASLADFTSRPVAEVRNRLLLADLYDGDTDDPGALEVMTPVLQPECDNLAAWIRLATTRGRMARESGRIDEAVAAARQVLARSPTNVRGYLELARALSSGQRYAESARVYEQLIAIDPTLRVPRRERARVLYANHDFAATQAAYQELAGPAINPPPPAVPPVLAGRSSSIPGPAGTSRTVSNVIIPAVVDPSRGTGDAEANLAPQWAMLDQQARAAESEADRLEGQVKDRDWQPYAIIPVAQDLVGMEPTNTSVLFDLGQRNSVIRQTRRAMDGYSQDLVVSPREREAAIGLARAGLELSPQPLFGFTLFSQNGRNGLAHITRLRYSSGIKLPYGDEDEFVLLGFTRADYIPPDDSPLHGNILTGGFQSKFFDRLLVGGIANLELYPNRFKNRVTFDAGPRFVVCDQMIIGASMYLQNVVENGESMRQDIYRYGARAGTDFQLSRCWTGTATYTYGHYSDRNDYNEAFFRTDYKVCLPPKELRVALDVDMYGYRASTVLRTDDPNNLIGAIHPYFAPIFFAFYEGRLEWKHWLSRDYFTHSNQCWYSLQYAIGWDNHFFNYNTLRVLGSWDVRPWLTVSGEAFQILSPVYNATGAAVNVVLRCPCLCH
jgi:tetratricopeptide (TPR) repeat protein